MGAANIVQKNSTPINTMPTPANIVLIPEVPIDVDLVQTTSSLQSPLTADQMRPIYREKMEKDKIEAELNRIKKCTEIMKSFNEDFLNREPDDRYMPEKYMDCLPEIKALGYFIDYRSESNQRKIWYKVPIVAFEP